MNTEIIVFKVNHYSMDDNKGLSVTVLGDNVDTNNAFGIDVSEATINNYQELNYLKSIPVDQFPARFTAKLGMTSIKRNGKSVTAISLSNLQYKNSLDLTDRKSS